MGRAAHLLGVVLMVVTCSLASRAAAQEYCVACSEPSAIYRCIIEGAQPGGGQSLTMQCVTTMAKQGGHATCGVKRGTVFDCNGIVKRIPWSASETRGPDAAQPLPWANQPAARPEPAATPQPASPSFAPPPQPPQPAPNPNEPPQTVLEMAKRANDDTVKQMKKAGETVEKAGETMKQATKKTWDCVVSFFTKC
jgi:hypothetical protein